MAIDLRHIFTNVHQWTTYQDTTGLPVASHLVVTEEHGCTLIDPSGTPNRHDIDAVVRIGRPDVIVLTTATHERDVSIWRQKLGVPVKVHAAAASKLRMRAFELLEDNEQLPAQLRAIHAPGVTPGEMAIYVPWNGGAFIIGDGLQNTMETHGLGLLPPDKCQDPIYLRASIEKLYRWPFEALLFSHGEPVIKGARDRLGWVLETAPLPRPKNLPPPKPKAASRSAAKEKKASSKEAAATKSTTKKAAKKKDVKKAAKKKDVKKAAKKKDVKKAAKKKDVKKAAKKKVVKKAAKKKVVKKAAKKKVAKKAAKKKVAKKKVVKKAAKKKVVKKVAKKKVAKKAAKKKVVKKAAKKKVVKKAAKKKVGKRKTRRR